MRAIRAVECSVYIPHLKTRYAITARTWATKMNLSKQTLSLDPVGRHLTKHQNPAPSPTSSTHSSYKSLISCKIGQDGRRRLWPAEWNMEEAETGQHWGSGLHILWACSSYEACPSKNWAILCEINKCMVAAKVSILTKLGIFICYYDLSTGVSNRADGSQIDLHPAKK